MRHPVPDGYRVKGVSTLRDMQTGEAKIQWQKTEIDRERQQELIQASIDAMMEEVVALPPIPEPALNFNSDLCSIIPMGDPHFGLYVHGKETMGDDFNLKIAERNLCGAVDYLVSQSPASERCIIINLGDFYHADNSQGTTTKGTYQDMDSRIGEVIQVGVSAIRQCIKSALERHKVVEVICAIGNHDEVLALALSVLLANVYENDPRVITHSEPTWRHYLVHGKVLIGVTHGNRTKDPDLMAIMAHEKPKEWGDSLHRYWYRGHLHHDKKTEFTGGIVEQFRTLAPSDAYSASHGYLAGSDMKLIVHHKEYGEVARSTCSVQMLKDLRLG